MDRESLAARERESLRSAVPARYAPPMLASHTKYEALQLLQPSPKHGSTLFSTHSVSSGQGLTSGRLQPSSG